MATTADLINEFHQATAPGANIAAPKILQGNFSGGKDAQMKSQKGSFLQRNLNSLGAAGGGLAGAGAGAAIGSVVPIVGTGIGAILGGIIGAAGGGAGGEVAKESVLNPGQAIRKGEVGKQALIGAAGDLAGQGIGAGAAKVLGRAGEAATEVGTNTLASRIGQEVNTGGKFLNDSTEKAILNQAPNLATFANNLGVKNPKQYEALGVAITGPDGALNGLKNQAIQSGGHVDMAGIYDTIKSAVGAEPDLVGANATKAQGTLVKTVNNLLGKNVSGMAAPEDVFGVIKELGTKAANTDNMALKNVYNAVGSELQDRLYNGAGANAAAKALVVGPEELDAIKGAVSNAGFKGNSANKITQYIADSVNNAQSIGDLRSAEAPAVKLSQLGSANRLGSVATGGVGGTVNKVVPNSPFQILRPLKTAATASEGVVGRGLVNAGGGLSTLGGLVSPDVGRAVVEGGRLLGGSSPSVQAAQPTDTTTPVAPQPPVDTGIGGTDVNGLIQQALSNPDAKSQSSQLALIGQLLDIHSKLGASDKATTAQQTQQLNAQNAMSVLDNVEQQFSAAGGGKGAVAGRVAQLGTHFNINAGLTAYDKTLTDSATALAKAITGSARPAASVINQYKNSLPQASDSPEVATQKLANLRQTIQDLNSNTTTALTPIGG